MTSASQKPLSQDAPVETRLDDDALLAIRSLVAEQPEEASPQISRDDAPPQDVVSAARPRRRKASSLPPLAAPGTEDPAAEPRKGSATRVSVSAKGRSNAFAGETIKKARALVDGYRLKPSQVVLGVFALLVVFRPWLMLGIAFVCLFIMIGVFLMAGYDGFWHGVIKMSRWYARRRPARAEVIHQRLDGFAMRWDAVLDRFPEGTVDGLYLPDFGELETADARHDEAMERRLASLRENNA